MYSYMSAVRLDTVCFSFRVISVCMRTVKTTVVFLCLGKTFQAMVIY